MSYYMWPFIKHFFLSVKSFFGLNLGFDVITSEVGGGRGYYSQTCEAGEHVQGYLSYRRE